MGKDGKAMLRVMGAAMLVAGAGGFGFSLAAHQRKQERMIRQLMKVLNEMEWELKFRLTPLPELCSGCAGAADGDLAKLFRIFCLYFFLKAAYRILQELFPEVPSVLRI